MFTKVTGSTGRRNLFHGLPQTDAIKGVVRAAHQLSGNCVFAFPNRQGMNGSDCVFTTRVDRVGCTKALCKFQLRIVQVDSDNRTSTGHTRPYHRRQANAADAKNGDAFTSFHTGGIDYCASPGHYRTTNYRGDIFFDIGISLHDILLVAEGVISPSEYVFGLRGASTHLKRCPHRQACCISRRPRNPGNKHNVAFINMRYCAAFLEYHARRFMAQ